MEFIISKVALEATVVICSVELLTTILGFSILEVEFITELVLFVSNLKLKVELAKFVSL